MVGSFRLRSEHEAGYFEWFLDNLPVFTDGHQTGHPARLGGYNCLITLFGGECLNEIAVGGDASGILMFLVSGTQAFNNIGVLAAYRLSHRRGCDNHHRDSGTN